ETHTETASLEEAGDEHRSEGGVVDVGVAADDDDVDLVPTPRLEIGPARGEEGVLRPGAPDGSHGPARLRTGAREPRTLDVTHSHANSRSFQLRLTRRREGAGPTDASTPPSTPAGS